MAGAQNQSLLPSSEENELLSTLVGKKYRIQTAAKVEILCDMSGSHKDTHHDGAKKFKEGVVCVVKDNEQNSHVIRLYDLTSNSMVHELVMQKTLTYKAEKPDFHSISVEDCYIGLKFLGKERAKQFKTTVDRANEASTRHSHRLHRDSRLRDTAPRPSPLPAGSIKANHHPFQLRTPSSKYGSKDRSYALPRRLRRKASDSVLYRDSDFDPPHLEQQDYFDDYNNADTDFIPLRPQTDEKSKKLFQEAMQKGYVVLQTVVLLLIGVAGAGKTCFCHLLFNEPPPLIRKSTALAQSSIRAISLTRGIRRAGRLWEKVTLERLNGLIADGIKGLQAQASNLAIGNLVQTLQRVEFNKVDDTDAFSDIDQLFQMDQMKELLRLISRARGSGEIFKRVWLYIIDSGGQPQFHELLPTFVHHVSAAALFVKLNEGLDSYPLIQYYNQEGVLCGLPYRSSSTHLQTLLKCLQPMQSRNNTDNTAHCPKLFFIGTHRDLEDKSEPLESKNAQLLDLLRQQKIFHENLVCHTMGNPDQLLYPLNAQFPTLADKRIVAQFRKDVMDRCLKLAPEYRIPIGWFVLEQLLQALSKDGVLSFDKCLEVSRRLGMDKAELEASLEYLAKLNLFGYFPKILPSVVFTTSQVFLNKVSELVMYSHDLNDGSSQCSGDVSDFEFREYGKISVEMLKRENFSSHYIKGLFEPEHLLDLWVELLVVARSPDGSFIMPAVLSELLKERLAEHRLDIHSASIVPIAIHYPGGLFPSGIFTSLISHLQNESNWNILMKRGKPACLHKNCVQFSVRGKVTANVTLIYSYNWIELHVTLFSEDLQNVCLIRDIILSGLLHAEQVQRYDGLSAEVAFFCPCHGGARSTLSSLHLATPTSPDDNQFMQCIQDEGVVLQMTDRHKLWLQTTEAADCEGKLNTKDSVSNTSSLQADIESQPNQVDEAPCHGFSKEICTASSCIPSPRLLCKPRLYELDLIRGNGKTVRVISRTSATWERVAMRLHFEGYEIRSIRRDHHFQSGDACSTMLIEWLEGKGRHPTTWETLIEALEEADLSELASDLKDVFLV